ncbi:MAG TPA: hypothetical protein VKU83_10655 [Puia sp.]|nr:hypothetical protein [Puia sp.]
MSYLHQMAKKWRDPLRIFKLFQCAIAVICVSIPALLRLADKNSPGFRNSISQYVYISDSYIYGMLLCVAAMMFIFNGAVYFQNEERLGLKKAGKWYNVVLGLSLFGVILFPPHTFEVVHYLFGGLFFIGNALVTGFFHNKKDRVISITLAVLTLLGFVFCYIVPWISLLAAEWISLAVISLHFIMQSGFSFRLDPGSTQRMAPERIR